METKTVPAVNLHLDHGEEEILTRQDKRTIDKFINTGFQYTSMYELEGAHSPRLDTILIVEETIRKSPKELTRTGLYHVLQGRVMYQTLKVVLHYLEQSNKIIYSGNKIVWIFTNEKLDRALSRGRKY